MERGGPTIADMKKKRNLEFVSHVSRETAGRSGFQQGKPAQTQGSQNYSYVYRYIVHHAHRVLHTKH